MDLIKEAIILATSFETILCLIIGIVVGQILGAIPGLGAPIGIGVLLPLTFQLDPVAAMMLLVGVYKGSLLGGSMSAILLNTPGTASAAATVIDGYPMGQKGLGRKALQGSIYASGFADLFSDFILLVGAVSLAGVALYFGPSEIFWVIVISLILTATLAGDSIPKGFLAIGIGLLIGSVGMDPIVSTARFGIVPVLGRLDGLDMVAVLLGIFALPEVVKNAKPSPKEYLAGSDDNLTTDEIGMTSIYGPKLNKKDVKGSMKAFWIGAVTGTVTGIMPGLGSSAAAFLSYGFTKQAYGGKTEEGKFGEGVLPGVVAAEAGNSAVSGANMLPMFLLGIPGSAIAAMFLASLMMHGITPGPGIFNKHGAIIYAMFFAMIIGNFINMICGNLLVKPMIWILKKDPKIIYPIVLLLCLSGIYSVNNRMLDVGVSIAIGVIVYFMQLGKIPIAPMALAFVLGGPLETGLRRSLQTTGGSFDIFFGSTINKVLIIVCIVAIVILIRQRRRENEEKAKGLEA